MHVLLLSVIMCTMLHLMQQLVSPNHVGGAKVWGLYSRSPLVHQLAGFIMHSKLRNVARAVS